MHDYIYREAARNALYEADAITMKGVEILNNFPAADVVEVVRCRDCEFSLLWRKNLYCQKLRDYWNRDRDRMVEDTDFCAWGLRKDGGQDK